MSLLRFVITAFRRRCPRCGTGKIFTAWMRMNERCPACGMTLEPGPGYYIGALYPNYAVTIILVTAGYWLAVFACGIPQRTALWGALWFVALFPIGFYPYARSLWLSLMYQIRQSQFEEGDSADTQHESDAHQGPA